MEPSNGKLLTRIGREETMPPPTRVAEFTVRLEGVSLSKPDIKRLEAVGAMAILLTVIAVAFMVSPAYAVACYATVQCVDGAPIGGRSADDVCLAVCGEGNVGLAPFCDSTRNQIRLTCCCATPPVPSSTANPRCPGALLTGEGEIGSSGLPDCSSCVQVCDFEFWSPLTAPPGAHTCTRGFCNCCVNVAS